MNIRHISSRDNPRFKYVQSLHDRKTAIHAGVVFIEGVRLCEDALTSGLRPETIIFSSKKEMLATEWCERFALSEDVEWISIPDHLFEKLGSTLNPQGIAAIVTAPGQPEELPVNGKDIYFVCEEISDPGNLGTIIRTADAFNFSAVILTEGSVDPFNEKAIRASMGSCFHIPIIQGISLEKVCLILKSKGVQLVASHLGGIPPEQAGISLPAALFIGNEARGLSEECSGNCDILVRIPMPGKAESLNASSAAAIMGYILNCKR